ncbi:MAG: hypothetical protein R3268_07465, partial [Acidiferrobacterales bacterium]|nr:hypothetical protein [Acidiferrobacterales bacterium]
MPDLTFVDELPARRGGGRATIITDDVLSELRANPGKWAVIKQYDTNPEAAASMVTLGRKRHTNDGFDFASRGGVL